MSSLYLHGGGDHSESRANTFGRFAQALSAAQSHPLVLLIAEANEADREASFQAYKAIFADVGISTDAIRPVFVSPEQPLTTAALMEAQPCGVFVCGGMTPFYHRSLCADRQWLAYLKNMHIPYGDTSAGAAVAAESAIVGGWQAQRSGQYRAMLFSGASEGLNELTVKPSLGLVPFAIDVHTSQWGTLLRLIHAVDLRLVPRGLAIDEDTMLEINEQGVQIYGRGHVYAVEHTPSKGVHIAVYTETDELPAAFFK